MSFSDDEKNKIIQEHEKNKIIEEEKLRELVRKPKPVGVWEKIKIFFNSPFGIFVCTSIILASFTTLYSNCQADRKKRADNLDVAYKLDEEIKSRLDQSEAELNDFKKTMEGQLTNPEEVALPNYIDTPQYI